MNSVPLTGNLLDYFGTLPDQNDPDGPGARAQADLLGKLMAATPGSNDAYVLYGIKSQTYMSLFFPHFQPCFLPSEVLEINDICGTTDPWWSSFSTAVICQAIYNITKHTRSSLAPAKIDSAVTVYNQTLLGAHAGPWYAEAFRVMTPGFMDLYSSPTTGDDLAAYITGLQGAWVTEKLAQAASITGWPDAVWELFHHCVKLSLLGATSDQITGALAALNAGAQEQGFGFANQMDGQGWLGYVGWMSSGSLTWSDIQSEATPGMLASLELSIDGMPQTVLEGNSAAFVEGPGAPYRA